MVTQRASFMVNGVLELPADEARVFDGDARNEDALFPREEFSGDFDNLTGRFAGAKNDFGKILAQRPMGVHLGKAEVGDGRGLEGAQHGFAGRAAGAKIFQQLAGFGSCHWRSMPRKVRLVTREKWLGSYLLVSGGTMISFSA